MCEISKYAKQIFLQNSVSFLMNFCFISLNICLSESLVIELFLTNNYKIKKGGTTDAMGDGVVINNTFCTYNDCYCSSWIYYTNLIRIKFLGNFVIPSLYNFFTKVIFQKLYILNGITLY